MRRIFRVCEKRYVAFVGQIQPSCTGNLQAWVANFDRRGRQLGQLTKFHIDHLDNSVGGVQNYFLPERFPQSKSPNTLLPTRVVTTPVLLGAGRSMTQTPTVGSSKIKSPDDYLMSERQNPLKS